MSLTIYIGLTVHIWNSYILCSWPLAKLPPPNYYEIVHRPLQSTVTRHLILTVIRFIVDKGQRNTSNNNEWLRPHCQIHLTLGGGCPDNACRLCIGEVPVNNKEIFNEDKSIQCWAGFNVSTNTVWVIWETVLQVKRPNQQYQSTEGTQNTQITEKYNKWTHKKTHSKSPSLH